MGDARRLSEAGVRRSSGLFYHIYVKCIKYISLHTLVQIIITKIHELTLEF